jgi:hypothetical protein
MTRRSLLALFAAAAFAALAPAADEKRWTKEQAWEWYDKQPWLVGCNFLPSTAINQLEMWQADTFDPKTIDKELGWAASIGMNTCRVYLHDLAYEQDPAGFKKRLDEFLTITKKHGIRPVLVFFDDCWNDDPKPGKQPAPVPGVHNSGWVKSPGFKVVNDPTKWDRLEKYVTDVLTAFGKDDRVLMWDLYNEPGNHKQESKSLPLVKAVFAWAWAVRPTQPLTVGVWFGNKELNDYQTSHSDVVSFHHYKSADELKAEIKKLKTTGYPIFCTEWMARTNNSRAATHLKIFKDEKVACINWGLVAGKSNTIFPWGSKKDSPEPKVWFHDLFRPDGTPYDPAEIALFRELTGRGSK